MGKLAKCIDIELDKPRKLLYNLNAMAAYEEKTGKNFLDLPSEKISATLLRVVLWTGLIHEDKKLTLEQVGDMLDSENMLEIQKKIVEAASANSPTIEKTDESEEKLPLVESPLP
ncbi:MAG: hypothetical protein M0Q46_06205 [Endomicrobiales bacterium]|nr:hypothetical protein [Endomicrobiales bacterium]